VKIKKDKEKLKRELSEKSLKELEYIMPVSARVVNVEHDYKVNKNMLEYIVTVQTSENIAQVDHLSKAEAQQLINEQNTPKEGEEAIPQNPSKRPINDIRNEFENNKNDTDKKE
jgi:similar to stage IV sporulation protein